MIKLLGVSLQCIGPPAKMTRSWKNAQTRVCNFPFCCDHFWSVDVGFLLSMQTHNEKVIVLTVRDGQGRFFLHRADWGKAKNLRDAARPGTSIQYHYLMCHFVCRIWVLKMGPLP